MVSGTAFLGQIRGLHPEEGRVIKGGIQPPRALGGLFGHSGHRLIELLTFLQNNHQT